MIRPAGRGARLILLALWFVAALVLAARHVMWRDEVRAFSFAIQGRTVFDMLRMLHGEGHPALWYLLLRAGYAMTGSVLVLPALAFAIGAGAATILALRAPFGWPLLALALFGRALLYEYTVMARNYGLSALILFAMAACYGRWRARGLWLGVLLALLCNTNVHSVVLAAAFMLFWAIDLWRDPAIGRRRSIAMLASNGLIAALGVVACVAEVYPAHNDIAQSQTSMIGLAAHLALLPLFLGNAYAALAYDALGPLAPLLVTLLLLGSLFILSRSPGALIAAGAALIGMFALFVKVYHGEYRHEALYVVFLLTMLWLIRDGYGGRWRGLPAIQRFASAGLAGLLIAGVGSSAVCAYDLLTDRPESRTRDLGRLLDRPALRRAIIVAEPDYMLEPLPYYADNPIYLVRERRFGRTFELTRRAIRPIGFGEMLATARMLHVRTGRPVVIVVSARIDGANVKVEKMRQWASYWYGTLVVVPTEVAAFRAGTRRIARFGPATSDESYDVYVLSGA